MVISGEHPVGVAAPPPHSGGFLALLSRQPDHPTLPTGGLAQAQTQIVALDEHLLCSEHWGYRVGKVPALMGVLQWGLLTLL